MTETRFINNTVFPKIKEAVDKVTELLKHDSKMILDLGMKSDWKYNTDPSSVTTELLKTRRPIEVFTYRPWNPWTKAIGYFDGNAIHINIKALDWMKVEDVIGNLIHEYCHYAGFTHGNNYKTKDKTLYSVPYYCSENIGKWV